MYIGNIKKSPILLYCDEGDVSYMESAAGHISAVLDPLPAPTPGATFTPITLVFTDLSSCQGGINRRDTSVVFSMEKDGVVLGRQVLPVKYYTAILASL